MGPLCLAPSDQEKPQDLPIWLRRVQVPARRQWWCLNKRGLALALGARLTVEAGTCVDAEVVCRRYGAAILRRCRGILKDPTEAEDAAQEVFITLLTKGEQFRGEAQVASWVYRITTNHCLNVLRSSKRRGAREQHDQVLDWLDVAPINPYEHVASQALLSLIVAELDDLDQQIFIYRYLDDLGQEEIASLVGRTRRTVYKRLKKIEAVAQAKTREGAQ